MFKAPFSFKGRIRRIEFWLSYVIYLLGITAAFLSYEIRYIVGPTLEVIIQYYLLFASIWLTLAQRVKRCHDLGNSGWFQLIPFYTLWLFFANGQLTRNKYGSNPKAIKQIDITQLGKHLENDAN